MLLLKSSLWQQASFSFMACCTKDSLHNEVLRIFIIIIITKTITLLWRRWVRVFCMNVISWQDLELNFEAKICASH